jgi:hypothetical protein
MVAVGSIGITVGEISVSRAMQAVASIANVEVAAKTPRVPPKAADTLELPLKGLRNMLWYHMLPSDSILPDFIVCHLTALS